MHYLTRWRMQLATRLLERPGIGVAQVAAEVGYESEAAFNRAFKKCVGVPPGAEGGSYLHKPERRNRRFCATVYVLPARGPTTTSPNQPQSSSMACLGMGG
jgi:AraC-like DNA-binding protein